MTALASLDSRASWLRLSLTLAIALVGNAGMWAAVVVMPSMQAEFGVDRAAASLPYTLFMVGFAAGSFGIGALFDRTGITRALWVCASLLTVGYTLAASLPSFSTVAILHGLIGFASAVFFGPLMADISLWFRRRRGIAVALVASGNYLSGAIWPLLLRDSIATDGWRGAYLILALVTALVILPLAYGLRHRVPDAALKAADQEAQARTVSTGLSPNMLTAILFLAGLGCCVAMSMPQVHIVSYCVDLGYGPAVGAEMLSLMLLGGVVSRLISGVLADWLGGVRTLLIGSGLQCLALFLYLPTTGLTPLYIVSLVFGLSQGGIVPSYAVIIREYLPAREAGTRIGLVMMATILGMALGGWMSGWIYDVTGSYQLAFLNGIAWNLLNIALIAMIFLRTRPGRAATAAA